MADKSRGDKTRQSILALAAQLFTLHGYHNTSLNDILVAVSISKGAFYHHFNSKEELALAVVDNVRQDSQAMFDNLAKEAASAGNGLLLFLRELAGLGFEGRWEHGLLLARLVQDTCGKESVLTQRVGDVVQWLLGSCERLIAIAQDSGLISQALSAEAVSGLILSVWFGSASLCGMEHQALSREAIFNQLASLLELSQ